MLTLKSGAAGLHAVLLVGQQVGAQNGAELLAQVRGQADVLQDAQDAEEKLVGHPPQRCTNAMAGRVLAALEELFGHP